VFIAEVTLKVPQWAAAVLTPSVAADAVGGRSRTIKLFWLATALAAAAYVFAFVLQVPLTWLITRVAGRDFGAAFPVTLALFPRVILQSGAAVTAGNLAGKGFTPYHPLGMFAGMVGVLAFDWLLIPRYGIIGGGLGGSAGFLLSAVIVFIGFLKHNDLDFRGFLRASVGPLRPAASGKHG
jgi:O-antigen/teichoic acid export membrane protein